MWFTGSFSGDLILNLVIDLNQILTESESFCERLILMTVMLVT